jgi:hypothetical protein
VLSYFVAIKIKGQVASIRPIKVDVMVLVTARMQMSAARIKGVHRLSFSKTLVKNIVSGKSELINC